MKKKLLFVFSFIFIFAISLFGCGAISLNGGPNIKDTVYGNGSNAVVKGNYLYFSNAYLDYTSLSQGQNEYNKEELKVYGIYRTKLAKNGVVAVDENGNPKNAELLVPLASGFENSGIYICGKYLYYTTVYTEYETGGNTDETKGFLNFERVDLNGQNRKTLSEKGDFKVDCEYSINYVNGTTYITILSDGKITVIRSKNDDTDKYQIASSVSDMCTASQQEIVYNKAEEEVNKYVYYTKTENNKYSLYRKTFANGTEETLINVSSEEITLEAVKNNRVYYKEGNILKSSNFEEDKTSKTYCALSLSENNENGAVEYIILNDTYGYGLDKGIAVLYYSGSNYYLVLYNGVGTSRILLSNDKQITILFATGNKIFYQITENDALYSVDIANGETKTVISKFSSELAYDFDSERVYFFDTVENSNGKLSYLQIALLNNNIYKNENSESVAQYIGVLDSSDVVKKDEK